MRNSKKEKAPAVESENEEEEEVDDSGDDWKPEVCKIFSNCFLLFKSVEKFEK